MKSLSLTGKVALVTGGSKGIGAAIARQFSALGAEVFIAGRTRSPLEAVAKEIQSAGGRCQAVPADVSDADSLAALGKAIALHHKKLHILVNNAGVGGSFGTPLHQLDPEEWDRVMNTNLRGVYLCIRQFTPLLMLAGAADIVNISSLAGKNALPKAAAYAASKWGLNGLSYSVAEEMRAHNIRVSVVCPGSVATLRRMQERTNPKCCRPKMLLTLSAVS